MLVCDRFIKIDIINKKEAKDVLNDALYALWDVSKISFAKHEMSGLALVTTLDGWSKNSLFFPGCVPRFG